LTVLNLIYYKKVFNIFQRFLKEYEIKTHHLRVYAIHEAGTGKIIICGGYKNTQKNNIRHFREVKNQKMLTKDR